MRKNCPLLIAAGLLTFVGLSTPNAVYSQTTHATAATKPLPCDVFASLGRPTLKRRGGADNSIPTVVEEQQPPAKCTNREDGQVQDLVGLRFVGLRAFHESEVIRIIQEEGVLHPDRLPSAETADKAAAVLKKLFSTKGYVFADVNVIRDEQFSSVTFQVTEGQRLPLADIRFQGTKVFGTAELKTVTRECLLRFGESEGAYDQEQLEYCLRNAANFLRSRGHLQAKLSEPKREIIGNSIVVNVAVDEGLLYRLGKIAIEGADHLRVEDIRRMLPFSQGDVANWESISKWLYEDLKKSYGDLGYIEYTAEPVPELKRGSEAEGVVDFKVIIEEGDRFTLRSIVLEGEQLPSSNFVNESALKPGEFYNQSAFAAFVNQLNQSGLFEPIDQDKDADFRVNNEEKLISIHLKLRKRAQP